VRRFDFAAWSSEPAGTPAVRYDAGFNYGFGGGGLPPKNCLKTVRMPRRFLFGCVGLATSVCAGAAGFVSATWPLKTQSFVTLASWTSVINCGFESTGGVGIDAENVSGGITTLTGGSSCGATGVDPNMWTATGFFSLAWSGMVKPLSASGAEPEMVLPAGGAEFFGGGLFASVGSAGGGGGGAAASTVGITDVVRGAPAEIAGGGCCAVAADDVGGCFGFELLAVGNGLAGVADGPIDAGCAATTAGADGAG
jgi:hypothetical protein